jgi:hypothetical protein
MASEPEKDISGLFRAGKPIDDALNAAVREAVKRHQQQGQPLVVWRNGRTVLVAPDEVEDERSSK